MDILLLNQTFYPDRAATAQMIVDLAVYLQKQGHQVTVITSRFGYDDPKCRYPKHEDYQGVAIKRIWSTHFGKCSVLHRVVDALTFDLSLIAELFVTGYHDMVISFTSPPLVGVIGSCYSIIRRSYHVQWLMDINPDAAIAVGYVKEKSITGRLLAWAFNFSLNQSYRLVVLDRWMAEKVKAKGITPEKTVIVPPWPVQSQISDNNTTTSVSERGAVTDLLHQDSCQQNPFRVKHALEEKLVVLYSGNHSVVHPLDTLIEVAIRLKNDDSVVFLFIGSGVRVADVEDAVQKHQLSNVIQLQTQSREVLPYSLGCADLHVVVMGNKMSGLVHTSKLYGVLATGKPYVFIGPQNSHGVDLLSECPHGYHVEQGDVESLLSVIEKVKKLSVNDLAAIEQANKEYIRKYYTMGHALNAFEAGVITPINLIENT